MAKIVIKGGDWPKGTGYMQFGVIALPKGDAWKDSFDRLPLKAIKSIERTKRKRVKRATGTAGWAVAGAVLAGPAGAVVGLMLGGQDKDVTFELVFNDGRRLIGTTTEKAFDKMLDGATNLK